MQELCEHPVDQRQRYRWIIRYSRLRQSGSSTAAPEISGIRKVQRWRRAGAASNCWRTQPQQQQQQQPSGPGRAIDERTRARHAAVHQLLGQA